MPKTNNPARYIFRIILFHPSGELSLAGLTSRSGFSLITIPVRSFPKNWISMGCRVSMTISGKIREAQNDNRIKNLLRSYMVSLPRNNRYTT
jgi:hypothetical protein